MRLFTINGISGYEKITHNTIKRWKKSKKVPGRKVSGEFEKQVAAELLIFNLNASENDMTDQVEILANSIYSYDCVKSAAMTVYMREDRWKLDANICRLKFSNKWVQGFLKRLQFTKRTVTSVMKTLPSVEVVQRHMTLIKDYIINENISPDRVFNADETGVNWAPEIKYQYVPADAVRASAPPGNESGRFTALLGSNAVGEMLPFYFIVKCACQSTYDLSTSTVLKKFHGEDKLCKPTDGWINGMWTTTIIIKDEPKTIIRPYLLNTNTLDLITVQSKAWNDTSGCLMWIELQLKAFKIFFTHHPDVIFL
jgi:hypothetical protein